jgi:hypothetical protein
MVWLAAAATRVVCVRANDARFESCKTAPVCVLPDPVKATPRMGFSEFDVRDFRG